MREGAMSWQEEEKDEDWALRRMELLEDGRCLLKVCRLGGSRDGRLGESWPVITQLAALINFTSEEDCEANINGKKKKERKKLISILQGRIKMFHFASAT